MTVLRISYSVIAVLVSLVLLAAFTVLVGVAIIASVR